MVISRYFFLVKCEGRQGHLSEEFVKFALREVQQYFGQERIQLVRIPIRILLWNNLLILSYDKLNAKGIWVDWFTALHLQNHASQREQRIKKVRRKTLGFDRIMINPSYFHEESECSLPRKNAEKKYLLSVFVFHMFSSTLQEEQGHLYFTIMYEQNSISRYLLAYVVCTSECKFSFCFNLWWLIYSRVLFFGFF